MRLSLRASAHTGVAIRFLPQKEADSHTSDIGHSLQVLGDEGAVELVRAFSRFGMTETQLCLQSDPAAYAPRGFFMADNFYF